MTRSLIGPAKEGIRTSHADNEPYCKAEIPTASFALSDSLPRVRVSQPTSITTDEAELLARYWSQLLVDARPWVSGGHKDDSATEMVRHASERLNVLIRDGLVSVDKLEEILSHTDAGTSTGHVVLTVPVEHPMPRVHVVNDHGQRASLGSASLAIVAELLRRDRAICGADDLHHGRRLDSPPIDGIGEGRPQT